jgi:16S rRNA (guanine527-N7)-methyltransferase
VKHPPSHPAAEPDAIAKSVRDLVARHLRADLPNLPSDFPERIERLAAGIALWGSRMNLTAHPEDPDEIAFHVIDSVMPVLIAPRSELLAGKFADGHRMLDIGSGAGFPGLVLAAASAARFTLIESRRKRASFLTVVVAEMELRNVEVIAARAEDAHRDSEFDLVTARAFGAAADFFALAARALKPGASAMLYANPSQRLSLDAARAAGLADYARLPYHVPRRAERVNRVLALWRKSTGVA